MNTTQALVTGGTSLLAASALTGFAMHRFREDRDRLARWRVIHVGGTAGAVQLIACASLWRSWGIGGALATLVGAGLILATWAFFIGPLASAFGHAGAARLINRAGAAVALPCYLLLPALFWS